MQFFLDTIQSERSYGQRVRDIEHAAFTPRVLSTAGGMGREATAFYKRLADLLSNKRKHPNHGLVKMSTFTVLLELHGAVHAYLSFLFKPFSHDGINDLESMNQHCNTCMKMECMR